MTIVTPTYNSGEFLRDTIESVLSQDYARLEYLVLDGGSSDATLKILQSYGDRVRWVSEPDSGQADAINRGFGLTRGEIFAFLNADDTYLPGAVSAIVGEFRKSPHAGMIYGEAYHVNSDGSIIGRYPTIEFDRQELSQRCYICQPAAFVQREALEKCGLLDTRLHYALDYELWIRLSKFYEVRKIDRYLATSRMHLGNKTLRDRKRVYRESLSVVKAHYGYVPFQWMIGYACHLVDGKNQFFDASEPTLLSHLVCLLLGLLYNPLEAVRYWREWSRKTGVRQKFRSRWEDRWISEAFETELEAGARTAAVTISGNHAAPFRWPLQLSIAINGQRVHRHRLASRGPFKIRVECPPEIRGTKFSIGIYSNKTFRPMKGDYRKLSCQIEAIELED